MFFKTIYNKDYTNINRLIHFIFGGILGFQYISVKLRLILFINIVVYQFGQLLFNVRYFIFFNKFIKGNSIKHTLNKLLDYLYGYLIISIINYIFDH